MACNLIDKLPTDIMSIVIALLPVTDIKNLRLVNKRAERESFTAFTFGYQHVSVDLSSLDRFSRVTKTSAALSHAVSSVQICFRCDQRHSRGFEPCNPTRWIPVDATASHEGGSTLQLLEGLPGLQELTVQSLRIAQFKQQFGPMFNVAYTRGLSESILVARSDLRMPVSLSRLCLFYAYVCRSHINALLRLCETSLRDLSIMRSATVDGKWCDVFTTINSLPQLIFLRLDMLGDQKVLRPGSVRFIESGERYDKAIKGDTKVEVISITPQQANMNGAKAIQVGLERVQAFMIGF